MKMPKALKTKWVKALRSGKYKQGTGVLYAPRKGKTPPKFCCLGVLEHCAMNGKVESYECSPGDVHFASLPSTDFYKKFGIEAAYDGHFNEGTAVEMNDHDEVGFNEIANEIEKYVETY